MVCNFKDTTVLYFLLDTASAVTLKESNVVFVIRNARFVCKWDGTTSPSVHQFVMHCVCIKLPAREKELVALPLLIALMLGDLFPLGSEL